MAAWSVAIHLQRGWPDLLWQQFFWTRQIGEAMMCGSLLAKKPARARECLAGEISSSEGRSQELLDQTLWWNTRQHKKSARWPHFRHKQLHGILWLNNLYKPVGVDAQVAALGVQKMGRRAGTSNSRCLSDDPDPPHRPPVGYDERGSVTAETVQTLLCQQGKLSEAVEALGVLVQTTDSRAVTKSLFYTVLKRCMVEKDLALGRRVHALIVEMGHGSDTFLCHHVLRMYASNGRLQDAMNVFSGVAQPDAFIWSSIISAHVKHGQAKQAIQLYRRMRSSSSIVKLDGHVFVAALQACASGGDLETGQQVHADALLAFGGVDPPPDLFVCNCLVNMYAKCDRLEDARRVFDSMAVKGVVTWNTMIGGYAQQGRGQEALDLYSRMQQEGITAPTSVTFVCSLQACSCVGVAALQKGREIHAQVEAEGLQADLVVGNSLVNMYAKCGNLKDAQRLFDTISRKDVVTWNAMIAGYTKQGMGQEALRLYSRMQQEGITAPDSVTFVCLLQACASVGTTAVEKGRQLYAQIMERGLEADVGCSLVNMYAKCGSLEDAHSVFDRLARKDVVTWNALIAGYAQKGMGQEALNLYNSMQQEGITAPGCVTFVCLLQACASLGITALMKGKQLHVEVEERGFLKADVAVGSSLVNMYAKCGSLEDAQSLFDRLPQKDVVTWTAMISGYSQQGMGQEALRLYSSMQQEAIAVPDSVTFVCLLQACASVGVMAMEEGKQLHAQITTRGLEADLVVGSSLVNMYAKCGSQEDAKRVFDGLPRKDMVTWNALIAGYAQQGMGQEALSLFESMQQEGITAPGCVTFVCLLQACASLGVTALVKGKQLHAQVEEQGLLETDVAVGSSLVNMYAKCGSIDDAQNVFDRLPRKNVVTWNAMIAGYAQQGMGQEALGLYSAMQQEGMAAPDSVTFVCLLHACASVAALHPGRQLHAQIEAQGLQGDRFVANSLINMYAKSGSMADAQQVFDASPARDIVAWNALIAGYTRQGDSKLVFDLVHRMTEEHSIEPNGITFQCLLTVCSHAGLVDKGRDYFDAMSRHHAIKPTVEHYTCMVDILGRAGQLDDALAVLTTMPLQHHSDALLWHTLLGACRKWGNVEVGRHAFDQAVQLDQKDTAAYVLMAGIYTAAQMWEEAQEMQARRVELGAWKQPGQSWCTDMGGTVHAFLVGDKNHPESEGIYARLQELVPK